MDYNLAMVLTLVDKITKPLKKIEKATKHFSRAEAKSRLALQKSNRAIKAAESGQHKYARSLRMTARALKAQANAYKFGQFMVGKATNYARIGGQFGMAFGRHFKKEALRFMLAGGLAIGLGFVVGKGFVETAAKFEDFSAVLETLEGSSSKAQKSMEWIQQFAVTTPYELDTVVESFVKLRAYGLDPTNGLLKTLGDTSAGMKKSIIDAVEAVADAVTGENERLKEFGIKASTSGNTISYKYTLDGIDKVAKATKGNSKQIQKVLSDIFNSKFAGSMDKLSKTWNGMVSNMSDQWTKFQNMVMASGLFDWMKGKLAGILDQLNEWEANGKLAQWAKTTGDAVKDFLVGAYGFFGELKNVLVEVWPVVKQVGAAFKAVADALGGWDKLAYIIIGLNFLGSLVSVAGVIISIGAAFVSAATGAGAFAVALLANPITWIVLAITAAVAGIIYAAYKLYENWDEVIKWFGSVWEGVKTQWDGFATWLGSFDLSSAAMAIVESLQAPFTSMFSWFESKFAWLQGSLKSIFSFGSVSAESAASTMKMLEQTNASTGYTGPSAMGRLGVGVDAFGQAKKYATGGLLRGPGTGTSDSIPFMGSHGEFIVKAQEASKHLGVLRAINNGKFGQMMKMATVAGGVSLPMMTPNLAAASPKYMPSPRASIQDNNGSIEINYNPQISITGGEQNLEAMVKKLLRQHAHELTRMVEQQQRRNKRKEH